MDALSSISPPPTLNQDSSFKILARRLKKAQACVDPTLSLPFPQVLCLATPLTAPLTSDASFFRPLQDLLERLKQHREACSLDKTVKALQKAETIYRDFMTDICQASIAKRTELLDITPAFVHQLINYQHTASLQALVEHQIAFPAERGISPLHLAAADGDEEMTAWLVQAKAKKEAGDQAGCTPLHYAILNGQLTIVRQLITLGANPLALTDKEESVLHLAASCGQEEILRDLLAQPCHKLLEARDREGKTPLHRAARQDARLVELLLAEGAEVNARDNNGNTPLHEIAQRGKLANAKLLLAQGAERFPINYEGESPLDLALREGHDALVCYLINPTNFKEWPFVEADVQDLEGFYYQCFENAHHQGEGIQQLLYLHKLSALYVAKKQWTTAAHLLNNACALAMHLDLSEAYQHSLLRKLEHLENCYLQELCGLTIPSKHRNYLYIYRQNLQEIRHRAQKQIEQDLSVKKIQQELTKRLQQLLVRLIEETFFFLQDKPPTSFAVIGLGSMSREEMAPYSDLEFAILVQEGTPANKAYFRRFSQLLALKIVNLGETRYDLIRPRRSEQEMHSSQSFTPHGFSLDSGGLSPLGKSGVYELIGLPQELAAFQTIEWLAKHEGEIILANALTTCCLIKGDQTLLETYKKLVFNLLNTRPTWFKEKQMRKTRALDLLKGHLEEFKPFLAEGRLQVRAFDAKKDFYRPLHMLIGALGLYYGCKSGNTLELLRELAQQGIINQTMAQKLEDTLTLILSLRLRAQFFYQSQKEIFYYAKEADDPQAAGLCLIQEEESQLALGIYRTLVPLQKLMQAFVQGNRQAFIHAFCYDANVGTRSQEAEKALNYQAAESAYLQRAALNLHDFEALNDVQRIKMTLGQDKAALGPALDVLTILRNKHGDLPHPDIVDSLNNLGIVYESLREMQQARTYYEQSLAMCKQLFGGKPHLGIAASLNNLGSVHESLGEMQQARAYYEQSLALCKQLFGDKPHPGISASLSNLGNVYKSLGEIQQARTCFEQSLAMDKQLFGDKPHPNIAISLSNLGSVYQSLGEMPQALTCHEQSLAMRKQLFGDKPHSAIATSLNNLGIVYESLGKMQQALTCHEQSLAMLKQLFDNTPHPNIANSLGNLGNIYENLGEMPQALSCHKQSLAMKKQLFDDKPHPDIAISLSNLGSVYQSLGEIQQARTYHEQSLAMRKQLFGDKPDPDIAASLNHLGIAYQSLGEMQQARTCFEQSLAMRKQLFGDKPHSAIATSLNNLGSIYENLGEMPQALSCHKQSLAMRKQLFGDKPHLSIAISLNNLGFVYESLGEMQQALSCHKQSLAMKKQLFGDKPHPDIVASLSSLGSVYQSLGEMPQALSCHKQSLAMKKQLFGDKPHPNMAITLKNLGNIYYGLGEMQQARAYYEQSLNMCKQLFGNKPHPDIATSLGNLGVVYEKLGEMQQARAYYEQSTAMDKQLFDDKPPSHSSLFTTLHNLGSSHQD